MKLAISGPPTLFLPCLLCPPLVNSPPLKFGLCAELDNAAYDVPARHRVGGAASRWAPGAVLGATVSTMVMVVGGGAFSSSATKSFCAYGGAGIVLGWVTQVGEAGGRQYGNATIV